MSDITTYLRNNNYKTIEDGFYTHIKDWLDWYKNGVDEFHKTSFFNGIAEVEREIKSLGMAKTVCETWANLLMNEKVEITTGDDASDEALKKVLHDNNFRINSNQLVELAFALGTGAFVEYIRDNDEIVIDYITADMIYPLSWSNRGITECAFGSRVHRKEGDCILLQTHTLKNKKYVIENKLLLVEDETVKELPLENGVRAKWETGSEKPLFQIIKPNIVNNVDIKNPMGVSVYANAIDCLKEIDTSFDALNVEIETGRRMVFLSSDMFFTDSEGNMRNVIGQKENVLRFMGDSETPNHKQIQDFTPTLRIGELSSALQIQLNMLSEKVGMGTNQFSYNNGSVATATQIISENSDMYQTMRKHELVIEVALIKLVEALAFLSEKTRTDRINAEQVSVNFDDSIIEDTQAVKAQAMAEFSGGLIDPVQYYQDVYKMTEEQAMDFFKKLQERNPKPEMPEELSNPDMLGA